MPRNVRRRTGKPFVKSSIANELVCELEKYYSTGFKKVKTSKAA